MVLGGPVERSLTPWCFEPEDEVSGEGGGSKETKRGDWWAGQDSNLQPDRYERPALTIELPARQGAPGPH